MQAVTFDKSIWFAIAEPSRKMLIDIMLSEGEASASNLARFVPFSRQAVSKHLVVLRKAGLIESHSIGKEIRFSVRPAGLSAATNELFDAAKLWDQRLQKIKHIAEAINKTETKE